MESWQSSRRCELEKRCSLREKQWIFDNIQRLSLRFLDVGESWLEIFKSTNVHKSQFNCQVRGPCLQIFDLPMMKRMVRVPHHSHMAKLWDHSPQQFKTFRVEIDSRHHRQPSDVPTGM